MSETKAPGWTLFADPVRGRKCGSCTLCCTLMPVDLADGWKPHNTVCKHECSKGCRIYEKRPSPCRVWSCKWLIDATTAGMRRPDHVGYVVDAVPDTIMHGDEAQDVIQVWVDPSRPDAHRDPALRAWLALMCERFGLLALVRKGRGDAFVLVPPGAGANEDWMELAGTSVPDKDMAGRLDAVGAPRYFGP